MNEYIYAECLADYWPVIKKIMAKSYNDAVEKIIEKYGQSLDDDTILNSIEDWDKLRDYLNNKYTIALSDLEIIDEL
jgi:hypothetical protein